MNDLALLCITNLAPHARPFIERLAAQAEHLGCAMVLAIDGTATPVWAHKLPECVQIVAVTSGGYLESVLDHALDACPEGYVLRVDDDEQLPDATIQWLAARDYRDADHWALPRRNLWPTADRCVVNPPLWPDLQTRLSVKAKSGGRTVVHAGSPYGTGKVAPVVIDHHKFLVRPEAERRALVDRYEQAQPGAGTEYVMFSLPELYGDVLQTAPTVEVCA